MYYHHDTVKKGLLTDIAKVPTIAYDVIAPVSRSNPNDLNHPTEYTEWEFDTMKSAGRRAWACDERYSVRCGPS